MNIWSHSNFTILSHETERKVLMKFLFQVRLADDIKQLLKLITNVIEYVCFNYSF